MLGAIIGDVIGSVYERQNILSEDFPLFSRDTRFTDDTVMTVAAAQKLLNDKKVISEKSELSYAMWYKMYYRRYPNAGYGYMFEEWANSGELYVQKSCGNGAAMRIVPIGYACDSAKDIKREVKASCHYTHNHHEAINCAFAVALAVYLARNGSGKAEIKKELEKRTRLKLDFTLDDVRGRGFSSRSRESVPQAIASFLEGNDYESTIRKAISIGGDSDTIACMAGGIAEAYYKEIPEEIVKGAYRYLDGTIKDVIKKFYETFNKPQNDICINNTI